MRDAADRYRVFARCIDIALRSSTTKEERENAMLRIAEFGGGKSVEQILYEMAAAQDAQPPSIPLTEQTKPWIEWVEGYKRLEEECHALQQKNAVHESPRFVKMRPKPDQNGYIDYSFFLVGLLAARKWSTRDVIQEFAQLAGVDQQEVVHWREKGRVPFHYYEMLTKLPFGQKRRKKTTWDEVSIQILRDHFSGEPILQDVEIARKMSEQLGWYISPHAVHCKASELGLLTHLPKRAGYRIKGKRTA